MEHFEYSVKRNFNPEYEPDGNESIVVHGLTEDSRKGFGNSTLYVPRFVHISAAQTPSHLNMVPLYGSHAELSPQKKSPEIFRPQLEGNKQTHPTANKWRQRNRPPGFGKSDLML